MSNWVRQRAALVSRLLSLGHGHGSRYGDLRTARTIQCESKKFPRGFLTFSPDGWEFLVPNFTSLL